MITYKLDAEEQELLDSVEAGEWVQVENFEEEKKLAMEAARNTPKKHTVVTQITEITEKMMASTRLNGVGE